MYGVAWRYEINTVLLRLLRSHILPPPIPRALRFCLPRFTLGIFPPRYLRHQMEPVMGKVTLARAARMNEFLLLLHCRATSFCLSLSLSTSSRECPAACLLRLLRLRLHCVSAAVKWSVQKLSGQTPPPHFSSPLLRSLGGPSLSRSRYAVQGDPIRCRTGNGGKLNNS